MSLINLSHLASTLVAYKNCVEFKNKEWEEKHMERLNAMIAHLPSGSGIDKGVKFLIGLSNADNLYFLFSFHHMDEVGGYDGWTEHMLSITPSFSGYNLDLSGANRNGIKDYLYDLFNEVFYVNPEEPILLTQAEKDEEADEEIEDVIKQFEEAKEKGELSVLQPDGTLKKLS